MVGAGTGVLPPGTHVVVLGIRTEGLGNRSLKGSEGNSDPCSLRLGRADILVKQRTQRKILRIHGIRPLIPRDEACAFRTGPSYVKQKSPTQFALNIEIEALNIRRPPPFRPHLVSVLSVQQ